MLKQETKTIVLMIIIKDLIIGTWTTDEVNKAIPKGYQILNVYEVWHFNKTSDERKKAPALNE